MNKNKAQSKINQQRISTLHYYFQELFPQIMKGYSKHSKNQLNANAQHRNLSYRYICDNISISNKVSIEKVLDAAKSIYFKGISFRMDKEIGVKEIKLKLKLFPVEKHVVDQIDLLIFQKQTEREEKSMLKSSESSFKSFQSQNKLIKEKPCLNKKSLKRLSCELFIIHHVQSAQSKNTLQWVNFTQKFSFYQECNGKENPIVYQAVMVNEMKQRLFSVDLNHLFLKQYFEQNCQLDKNGKSMVPAYLASQFYGLQTELSFNHQKIDKKSYDPIHRRLLSIPKQHVPLAHKLHNNATSFYRKLYPQQKPNPYFLENLTCRMMQNNNFKQESSWQAIQYYLLYVKKLKQKYTWDSFKEYRQMNLGTYIGKDKKDRPIVLVSVKNAHLSQIKDKQKFYDFQFYFPCVYLQEKMEGWVDQCDVLFDAQGHSSDNAQFSKTIVLEAYKLFYGSTKHIVGFNIGLFTKMMISLLLPFLPEQFVKTVDIFGKEKKELLSRLRQYMEDEVIPDYLGGKNHQIYEDISHSVVNLEFPSSLSNSS